MIKKRAIVSYEKLSLDQKKQLLLTFPDGFNSGMTQIKTPNGDTLDALLWETEEVIYLIKIPKPTLKNKSVEDEDDDFYDELPKIEVVKVDQEHDFIDDEVDDDFDVADDDDDAEEEKD
jgi:hypothetical protein